MSRADRLRSALVVIAGAAIYVALWSDLTVANVVWGGVFGALTLVLFPLSSRTRPEVRFRVLAILRYLVHVFGELVKSSLYVAYEVLTPGDNLNQGIVEVPMRTRSAGVITLVANSVSLTPGTLTLEVASNPTRLYVHVMHLNDVEEVREQVRRMEDLAMKAFPSAGEAHDTEEVAQ